MINLNIHNFNQISSTESTQINKIQFKLMHIKLFLDYNSNSNLTVDGTIAIR